MDADSGARSPTVGSGSGDRMRGLALLLAALLVLTAGGVWWTVRAPVVAGPPAAGGDVVLDPRSGSRIVVDPVTGRMVAAGRAGLTPGSRVEADDGAARRGVTIWSDRATITPRDGLVRRSSTAGAARYLLQFSCTGPGELLVVIDGARYTGPLTSGCGGSVTTATEVTGTGGPVQVSFSTVNDQPLRVEAWLVEFP